MKQTINFNDFVNAFNTMGRKDNFSYDGLRALFDYLKDYEESTGQELELDVITLCCKHTEYADVEDFVKCWANEDYTHINDVLGVDINDFKDDEEGFNEAILQALEEHTLVIRFQHDDAFIIAEF